MKDLLEKLSIIQYELKAPKNQRNTFGNYNYRSAEDILEAVKPLLKENGLTIFISDDIKNIGDRYYLCSTVTVALNNEQVSVVGMARESEDKKGMDAAQITGAASSYARKYALNGMFAIDDTKDPDTDENYNQSPRDKKEIKNTTKESYKTPQEDNIRSMGKQLGYSDVIMNAKIATITNEQQATDMINNLTKLISVKEEKNNG